MRYTAQDRDVIGMHITRNTGNIRKACHDAGAQLGRSGRAVLSFYYRDLRRNLPHIYGSTINGHVVTNIKNVPQVVDTRSALHSLRDQL